MGLLASLLSATFAAAKDLCSKRLSMQIDGTASTFASFAFALPFYLVVLAGLLVWGKEPLTWSMGFFTLLLLRASTDALAEGLKMHAFALGDISIVVTFFSISPLLLLILSPVVTGDPLSVPGVIAVVLSVGGSLLLVYRPSSHSWTSQKKAILLAILASLFFSLNSCFDRLAVQESTAGPIGFMKPVVAGFTMTLVSAVLLLPVMFFHGRWRAVWMCQNGLWLRGKLEVAFMVAKLYALQYLQAPDVVAVQRLSLLLSILGGRFLFREEDFGRRLAAGILILAGTLIVAWFRW
jgi:uncharacterized membrane protein